MSPAVAGLHDAIWDRAPCDAAAARRLADALGVHPIVARLLCLRGIASPDEASRFLEPSLDHLHDPWRLADMDRAVDRLSAAIADGDRVIVHGDYDVDGVTSTVIVRRALEMLGANVDHFVPERVRDGYGLQPASIDRLHALGARVIVSVDCGIRSVDAAQRARELGLDLIITDHHEPGGALPQAFAVINPKRPDCAYPDKNLAGVGVALKLVQALCDRADRRRWLPAFVKIAAIGTVADVVPLLGENRVIAKLGLAALSTGRHTVGLRSLLEAAGLSGRQLDGFHVSFVIAPRVNAAGRMSTPDLAARLLLIADEALSDEARGLAEQLNTENLRRQKEEAEVLAEALAIVEADGDRDAAPVLVVGGEGWHRGVIGIVASRLVDRFCRPAVVLSFEDGVAHGSCRSVPAFDMLGGLETCRDLFDRYGGHRQAAGLTMQVTAVGDLRARLTDHARACLGPDDLRRRLRIDAPLGLGHIDTSLVQGLAQMGPFGAGNPRPIFHAEGVELVREPRTIKETHLKLSLRQGGRTFQAMAWRAAERAEYFQAHRGALDVAFSVVERQYRGEAYLELELADVRGQPDAEPVTPVAS